MAFSRAGSVRNMIIDPNWDIYIEKDSFTMRYHKNTKKEVNVEDAVYMLHLTCQRHTRIAVTEEETGKVFFNLKPDWKCSWCKCEFPGEPETLKAQIKQYIILYDISQLNI